MGDYYPQIHKTDFKNTTLPVGQRIAMLLGEVTLEEKVGQLGQHIPGWMAYKKEGTQITITDSIKPRLRSVQTMVLAGKDGHGGVGRVVNNRRVCARNAHKHLANRCRGGRPMGHARAPRGNPPRHA